MSSGLRLKIESLLESRLSGSACFAENKYLLEMLENNKKEAFLTFVRSLFLRFHNYSTPKML